MVPRSMILVVCLLPISLAQNNNLECPEAAPASIIDFQCMIQNFVPVETCNFHDDCTKTNPNQLCCTNTCGKLVCTDGIPSHISASTTAWPQTQSTQSQWQSQSQQWTHSNQKITPAPNSPGGGISCDSNGSCPPCFSCVLVRNNANCLQIPNCGAQQCSLRCPPCRHCEIGHRSGRPRCSKDDDYTDCRYRMHSRFPHPPPGGDYDYY